MNLGSKLKMIEKFAVDNSPSLLTAVGVVGTVGTAVLTHKAAMNTEGQLARYKRELAEATGKNEA